jgi:hypothetical protein
MHRESLTAAAQLAGLVVGIAAVYSVILMSLGFLQSQCEQGTPRLAVIFPCFTAQLTSGGGAQRHRTLYRAANA